MQRDHHASGAVVVHHKVVDAADNLTFHHDVADLLHELLRWRLAEQRREGVPCRLHARPQDEQRHDQAAPAVDLPMQEIARECRKQHRRGRRAVGQAVRRGRLHDGGADLLPHAAVVAVHVELGADGDKQDRHRQHAALHSLGMQDRAHGVAQQFKAHQQNDDRDDEARDILQPPVAERMLGVGLLPGQTKAQQRHDGRARVGQVVKGVRRDGDRARKRPRKQLEREEQQIDDNAHRSAKHTVSAPHCGIRRVLIVFDEPTRKKTDHSLPSLAFDL